MLLHLDIEKYGIPTALSSSVVMLLLALCLIVSPVSLIDPTLADPDYHVAYNPSSFPTKIQRQAEDKGYIAGYFKDSAYVNSTLFLTLPATEEWNPRFDVGNAEFECAHAPSQTKVSLTYKGRIGRNGMETLFKQACDTHSEKDGFSVVKTGALSGENYDAIVYNFGGRGYGRTWLEKDGHVMEISVNCPGAGQAERFFRALADNEDAARINYKAYEYETPSLSGRRCAVPAVGMDFAIDGDMELTAWLAEDEIAPIARMTKENSQIDDVKIDVELVGIYNDKGRALVSAESDCGFSREEGIEEYPVELDGMDSWCFAAKETASKRKALFLYVYKDGYLVKISFRGLGDFSDADKFTESIRALPA